MRTRQVTGLSGKDVLPRGRKRGIWSAADRSATVHVNDVDVDGHKKSIVNRYFYFGPPNLADLLKMQTIFESFSTIF